MRSGNQIALFAERKVIIYNVKSKKYTILSDDQHYQSIELARHAHSVIKYNNTSRNSSAIEEKEKENKIEEEYISFDSKHMAIYRYDGKNSHTMKKLTIINKMNDDLEILSHALCCSLVNRNGTFLVSFVIQYM